MWVYGFLLHDRWVCCWSVPLHWHWMLSDSKNVGFTMDDMFAMSFSVSKDVQAFTVHRCTDIVDKAVSFWVNFSWSLLLIHSFSHLSAICNRSLNLIRLDFSDSPDIQCSRNWKPRWTSLATWRSRPVSPFAESIPRVGAAQHFSLSSVRPSEIYMIYMFVNMLIYARILISAMCYCMLK